METTRSPLDAQADNSYVISELGILLEFGGIENIHTQSVNYLFVNSQHHNTNHGHADDNSACP